MDKKLINEDISNMKYLFGYKPGRVISEQNIDYTTEDFSQDESELDEEGKRRPERLVKHIDTGKLVGTHKYGRGFTPNPHGEELGFEHHPSSIPNKTKFGGIEIDDFDYEDEDFDFKIPYYDDEGQDMDTGEELYPSFSSDRKFMGMSKSMDDMEIDEDEDNLFEQEEPENDRYMFFSNLQQIHRQMGILLEKDPEMIHSILENGHDWAQDHIATAKESIDQVFDFIMNEEEGDGEEMFEGYEYDDVDEVNPDDFNDDNENDLNQLKQKHGIKFRKDFEGSDDEFIDYLYDNKDSFDNFKKDNNRIKIPTDPIVFDPTDDETSQLKQKHGVKFRDEFEGDDDEFMDYLYDNRGSFDNFSKDLKDLRQTKRNR
jgi:hypothetical protein